MKRLSPRLDLPALLAELDITVTDVTDDEVHGLCPGQVAKGDPPTRSHWSVNRQTGQHFCFSCGFGGGLVTLVCEQQGWFLRTRGSRGERIPDISRADDWVRSRALDASLVFNLPDWERPDVVRGAEMGEFRLAAFASPPLGALKDRRLTRQAVEAHSVRWEAGLRSGAWVLPVRDADTDELLGWQLKGHGGTRLFRNHPRGMKKSSTLFGLDVLGADRTAVLVESPLDAVRLTGLGQHGLSSFGAAVSERQFRLLEARCDCLVVAMDNPSTDQAGRTSAVELLQALGRRIEVRFLDYAALGGAKDIGDAEHDEQIIEAIAKAKHAWRGRKAIGA